MIKTIKISKLYGKIKAVHKLDLDVKKGIIYGFIGPNGAGKTTTIKMLAGILKPTSGKIFINGMDMSVHPVEIKKIIGYIPDRPFLYEKLTGYEFLKFVSGLYMVDSVKAKKRIKDYLDLFELERWQDELIESYSHGMKQRLIMSSALIHEPALLIVDEPMVGLDPKAGRLVKDIFKRLAQKNTTIFMSTHTLSLAHEICDEIAVIQKGSVIASGTTDELMVAASKDETLEDIFLKLTNQEGVINDRI